MGVRAAAVLAAGTASVEPCPYRDASIVWGADWAALLDGERSHLDPVEPSNG